MPFLIVLGSQDSSGEPDLSAHPCVLAIVWPPACLPSSADLKTAHSGLHFKYISSPNPHNCPLSIRGIVLTILQVRKQKLRVEGNLLKVSRLLSGEARSQI